MIKKFIQTENDTELLGLVGNYIVSKKVHDELGTAITTNEKDEWLVKITKDKASAFLTMRQMNNNSMHIRFVFGSKAQKKELILSAIKISIKKEITKIWTNDRETELLWEELEFIKFTKARGSFCKWEKDLKND